MHLLVDSTQMPSDTSFLVIFTAYTLPNHQLIGNFAKYFEFNYL